MTLRLPLLLLALLALAFGPAIAEPRKPSTNSVRKVSNEGDSPAPRPGGRKTVIIIDPGHGGHHKGGGNIVRGRRVWEKEITLQIAERIERIARRDGRYEVRLTRREDVYVGLAERTQRAEQMHGDIFVSLHTNAVDGDASRKARAKGIEFWTWSPDGSRTAAAKWLEELENEEGGNVRAAKPLLNQMMIDALTAQALESRRVARALENSFMRESYYRANYRGIDGARFKVLENYSMPSVLIEYGFLTHPEESKRLADPSKQEEMARLTYEGIAAYLRSIEREDALAQAR